jgi:hypothetical protein
VSLDVDRRDEIAVARQDHDDDQRRRQRQIDRSQAAEQNLFLVQLRELADQLVDVDGDLGHERQQGDDQRKIKRREQPARGKQKPLDGTAIQASAPCGPAILRQDPRRPQAQSRLSDAGAVPWSQPGASEGACDA